MLGKRFRPDQRQPSPGFLLVAGHPYALAEPEAMAETQLVIPTELERMAQIHLAYDDGTDRWLRGGRPRRCHSQGKRAQR
jgi:hypothetical protein